MKYAAVIAAAGLSSRMKEFKPMLTLGETTLIDSVIRNLQDAGTEEIVVVTGYRAEVLEHYLKGKGVSICRNTSFATTKMYDSICLGLKELKQPYDAVLLTPGDVPLVQSDTIRRMMGISAPIVRPICNGKHGHPVLIDASCIHELLEYGGERGLKGAMESISLPITDIEVDDTGILLDADTPEDFQVLRQKVMENRNGGRLWSDVYVRIGKGNVSFTPETALFLEMIEHTGSIQSACTCVHISYTKGWKLLNETEKALGYPLVERFSGGASGGGSILTPQSRRLLETYQRFRDEVRHEASRLFSQLFSDDLYG